MEKATPMTNPSLDQTQDFMNVDSFSKLPFIRPTIAASKSSSPSTTSSSGIRLFGIDFSSSATMATTENSDSGDHSLSSNNNNNDHLMTQGETTKENDTNNNNERLESGGESSRKFECHYCCRNFPTSQALGGHQNAHKRERQHAKRAHLHSAMLAATDSHYYGTTSTSRHFLSPSPTPTNPYYPSYSSNRHFLSHPTNTNSSSTYSLYHHHQSPTINGSPLGAWRVPTGAVQPHHHAGLHRDRSLPLFSGHSAALVSDSSAPKGSGGIIPRSLSMNSSSQREIIGFDRTHDQFKRRAAGDHVSLDLHL